jgi:hypothetical protein
VSETAIILFVVGGTLVLALVILDDLIIRDVCRREGKRYSLLWPYSPYWQLRIFNLAWFEEARKAGLHRLRIFIFLGFALCILIAAAAALASPSATAPR